MPKQRDAENENRGRPKLSSEERYAHRRLSKYKAIVKKSKEKWELTDYHALALLKARLCHYCRVERRTEILSQKNTALEFIPSNVVPCCRSCNRARGRECYEVFIAYRNASALAITAMYQG